MAKMFMIIYLEPTFRNLFDLAKQVLILLRTKMANLHQHDLKPLDSYRQV